MLRISRTFGIVYGKGVYRKVEPGDTLRLWEDFIQHLPYGIVWKGKRGVRMFY